MSFSHIVKASHQTDGKLVSSENTLTAGLQVSVDENVADSATDLEITVTLDVSEIAAIYILSDQAVTFETNSGAAPDETIALLAGVPYVWDTNSYFANLLVTDITSIFITNASGSTARIQIEAVVDPTP